MAVKIDLSKNRDKDVEALEEPLSRAGFYTIAEAVEVVKREADVNIHDHLIEAVRSGALPTYEPNSTKRYIYGKDKRVRDFHEEVYWQDLNDWLEVNERLISYRLLDPSGKPTAKAKAAGYDTNNPWWTHNPKDPEAEQYWFTPARYFARELLKEKPNLKKNRDKLADETAIQLKKHEIYGRMKGRQFNYGTVLKAFKKVKLY